MKLTASARTIFSDPVHFLAFGFGAGLIPVAPGTAGTLVAVGLEWLLRPAGFWVRVAVTLALIGVGIAICGASARRLRTHDHPGIVLDEIAGYFVTMLAAPAGPGWMLAGFLFFRVFDILKPWPIRELDHSMRGGAGIMLDDVLAGVFAGLILLAARYVI